MEPPLQEAAKRLESTTTNGSHSVFENPFARTSPKSPPRDFSADFEYDTMSYAYPRYNDEADLEAHVRAFLNIWQTNNVSQRLAAANANASKIAQC